jgi:hypothetical protein
MVAGRSFKGLADTYFVLGDIEKILSANGYVDSVSRPQNSNNIDYSLIDNKSIRILNRLRGYLMRH